MKLNITKLLTVFNILLAVTVYAQDSTRAEFKPSGKVWGYAFGDYAYKVHADSLNRGNTQYANTPKNYNSFEFRRIYLGYDYNISEKFAAEFLLSYEGTTLSDNATRTIFIKAANIRWKGFFKNADLVFGQSSTPSFSQTSEKVWGYRSIEKTVFDMRKTASSSDLGLALLGKFNDAGTLGYHFMVGIGTAQKMECD
jgi:hypothetical protein